MPTTPKEDRREPAQSKVSPNKVYKGSEVDKEPEYPGGNQALLADIARSIRYPMICKQQKIQGDVLVSFIVEKDGSVSDVTAVKKVHANLNTEAVRVVKSLKEWTPGIKDGQPVRVQSAVYVTLVFNFNHIKQQHNEKIDMPKFDKPCLWLLECTRVYTSR
ncbi:energy transducer TonB [Bacteroides sp. CR5/BHMF/2]|nr:energy transducer TonB [Bacteroides sp. CR5/BHMF/2]